MRGRTVFLDALRAAGVRALFGNPGTTENPILDALADYPEIRYVMTLHEAIAVTAASMYAHAARTTAVANVHVAPGLGNALGALYGAWKAHTPLILTAGQQDTRMRLRDPLLQHDLVAMAGPLVKWAVQVEHADEMAITMHRALRIANEAPTGPVFIALPVNVMEQETAEGAWPCHRLYAESLPDPAGIDAAADLLARARNPVILAADAVAHAQAGPELERLVECLGAPVYHLALRQHVVFPNRHAGYGGVLPWEAAALRAAFADVDALVVLGGPFFEELWYDERAPIPASTRVVHLSAGTSARESNFAADVAVVGAMRPTLAALAHALVDRVPATLATERLGRLARAARARADTTRARLAGDRNARPMSALRAIAEIAAATPAEAIIVDESITAMPDVAALFDYRAPGDYFGQRGGGIGQGVAGALGVALARPDRPVLAITGDGSAMYSIQALWTAALLDLRIVFIVLANQEYRVLKHNLDTYRQRFGVSSNRPYPHMDLAPTLDFTAMARGMGVQSVRIEDPEALASAVRAAFESGSPRLIEVTIARKP